MKHMVSGFVCLALAAVAANPALSDGGLPEGYTELQWIEATGTQWIISGYTPSCTDRIEMKMRFGSVEANQCLWCSRADTTAKQTFTCFLIGDGTQLRFDRNTSTTVFAQDFTPAPGNDYTVVADGQTLVCSVNGTPVATMADGTFSGANNLTFFASYAVKSLATSTTVGNMGTYRLYSVRIYNAAGKLVREFLPARKDGCEEPDNTRYGLFETQTQSYKTTVNTNVAFNAGNELGLDVAPIGRQVYRGTPCEPEVVVTDKETGEPVAESDYDVVYEGNAARGTGQATVIGKGAYAGKTGYARFAVSGIFADDYLEIEDDLVVVKEVGNRRVYVFTDTTGETLLKLKQAMTLEEALVVGGGGAGGWGYNASRVSTAAGGGGGGVVFTNLVQALATDDLLSVTVGKGGDPRANYDPVKHPRPTGGNGGSSFLVFGEMKVEAYGGGGGTGSGESRPGKGKLGSSGGFRGAPLMDIFNEADGDYYDSTQGWYGGYTTGALAGGGGGAGRHRNVAGASVGNANNASDGGEGRPSFITGECEVYGSGGGSGGWENYGSRINGGRGGTHAGTGARLMVGTNGTIFNADDGFGGGGGGGSSISDAPGGKGGSGTVVLSFAIGDTTDGHLSVEVPANYPYDAEGLAKPDPVVMVGETLLARGEDYEVSYAGNLTNRWESGFAEVTVTGKGTYAGKSVTKSFRAVRAFMVDLDATEAADGRSWATATTFADAYSRCGNDWEIWLKAGSYARSGGITIGKEIAVRGGFAGDDDDPTKLADEPYTVFDGQNSVGTLLTMNSGSVGYPMIVERCWFRRATGNMVIRNNAGADAIFVNCKFTDTEANKNRGARGFAYNGYTTNDKSFICFRDCLFANLLTTADNTLEGYAINVNSVGCLHLWNCQFVSNGVPLSATSWFGNSGVHGASIRVAGNASNQTGKWSYIRAYGCKFIGGRENQNDNGTWNNSAAGSAVYLSGDLRNCEFANCLFLGNEDTSAMGTPKTNPGGAFYFGPRNGLDSTVTVSRCTFAYNLASGMDGAAGFHLAGGVANVRDSIFYGNVVGSKVTVGADMHVASSAFANVSNTLFAAEAEGNFGAYVSAADSTHLALTDVYFGNPRFVTDRDTWLAHLKSSAGTPAVPVSPHYVMIDPATSDAVYGFDVHLKSPGGYFTNDGVWHEDDEELPSDAILSDGRNLGCYAGTAEESKLLMITPELEDLVVDWKDGYSQPVITFTPGGKGSYNANVTIVYGVEGDMRTAVLPSVPSGSPYSFVAPTCFAPGSAFTVSVKIDLWSASVEKSLDSPITIDKDYPPSWGKGGGAGVIHVSATATGRNDGSDWFNAYTDFYQKLDLLDENKNELWISGDLVSQATPAAFKPKCAVTIRGGFAGTETTPGQRAEGSRTVIDGLHLNPTFILANANPVTVERIVFRNSSKQGLLKNASAGDLTLRDCRFTCNCTNVVSLNGRGACVTGVAGETRVRVEGCSFDGNVIRNDSLVQQTGSGFGLCLSSLKSADLVNCDFVTNGLDNANLGGSYNYWTQASATPGSALCASGAPVSVNGCRFVGNRADQIQDCGAVAVLGGSGGSAFTNCLFIGNSDQNCGDTSASNGKGGTGALRVNLSSTNDTVDVVNCTFAFNFSDARAAAAGLTLQTGTAYVKNSIFWGNVVGGCCQSGADIHVGANSKAFVDYTLVATNLAAYCSTNTTGQLVFGAGMVYGNPLFVSPDSDMTDLIRVTSGKVGIPKSGNYGNGQYVYFRREAATAAKLCAFNVHVKGARGYKDEATGEVRKYPRVHSPAIDAGDPASPYANEAEMTHAGSNGKRVNLGYYGNTRWSTMSAVAGSFLHVK